MTARVLVVDDDVLNRQVLARAVGHLGHEVLTAEDGEAALALLRAQNAGIDVVLLDLLMPVLDGFATLRAIKADPALEHLPVLMVSAVEDLESVVRCVELGAIDYLPKPVHRPLLEARLRASLAAKRLRDTELDHLAQVDRVVQAAVALEGDTYDGVELESVARRDDALGTLARVFQRMAREVVARQQALRRELEQLRIEIDQRERHRRVEEITGSDWYRRLAHEATDLKRILTDDREATDG